MLNTLIEYVGLFVFGFTFGYFSMEVYHYIKYGYTVTGSKKIPQLRRKYND